MNRYRIASNLLSGLVGGTFAAITVGWVSPQPIAVVTYTVVCVFLGQMFGVLMSILAHRGG